VGPPPTPNAAAPLQSFSPGGDAVVDSRPNDWRALMAKKKMEHAWTVASVTVSNAFAFWMAVIMLAMLLLRANVYAHTSKARAC